MKADLKGKFKNSSLLFKHKSKSMSLPSNVLLLAKKSQKKVETHLNSKIRNGRLKGSLFWSDLQSLHQEILIDKQMRYTKTNKKILLQKIFKFLNECFDGIPGFKAVIDLLFECIFTQKDTSSLTASEIPNFGHSFLSREN